MADRTAAAMFAMLFESIASDKPLDAKKIWSLTSEYDFSPYQMGCDRALEKLGLLWKCHSKQCLEENDGYPIQVYGTAVTCKECGSSKEEKCSS